MKRRSFFATLAGALALPKLLQGKEKEKHLFNPKVLKDRMDFLRKYPRTEAEAFHHPLVADGWLEVGDQEIFIYTDKNVALNGEIIQTTEGNRLYVTRCEEVPEPTNVIETFRRKNDVVIHHLKYRYRLIETHSTEIICGVPVIKIHGKYRIYRAGKHEVIKIQFMPIMSPFKEGSTKPL